MGQSLDFLKSWPQTVDQSRFPERLDPDCGISPHFLKYWPLTIGQSLDFLKDWPLTGVSEILAIDCGFSEILSPDCG